MFIYLLFWWRELKGVHICYYLMVSIDLKFDCVKLHHSHCFVCYERDKTITGSYIPYNPTVFVAHLIE